jgi:hypothetical protein
VQASLRLQRNGTVHRMGDVIQWLVVMEKFVAAKGIRLRSFKRRKLSWSKRHVSLPRVNG